MKKGILVLVFTTLVAGGMGAAYAERDGYRHSEHEYDGRHHGKKGKHCNQDGKSRLEKMREHLGLSDEQFKKISGIRDKYKARKKALREKAKANRKKLRAAKHADNINMADIRALAKEEGELRAQKIILKAEKRKEINAVLTKEQISKMKEMRQKHRKHRKGGHHGRDE